MTTLRIAVRKSGEKRNGRSAILALTTGCFIAANSLIDDTGERVVGSTVGFNGELVLRTTCVFASLMD